MYYYLRKCFGFTSFFQLNDVWNKLWLIPNTLRTSLEFCLFNDELLVYLHFLLKLFPTNEDDDISRLTCEDKDVPKKKEWK